jgi:hypothetical protein
LSRLFNQCPLSEKSICDTEDSRAVATNNLCKGRLVAALRFLRQFEVEGVFKTIRQI